MIYLRSFDRHDHVIELTSNKRIEAVRDIKPHGWFKKVGRQYSCLYVDERKLILTHGSKKVVLNSKYQATNFVLFGVGRFSLFKDGSPVFKFWYFYDPFWWTTLLYDDAFVEKEHFIWGRFLANVVNNTERQQIQINAHLEQA